jgi:hypothetical protein
VLEVHDAARDDAAADAGSSLLEDVEDRPMSFQIVVIWLTPWRELLAMRACCITVEGEKPPPHELMLGVGRCGRPRRALDQGQGEVSRL